jgi:hypothetical protein
MELREFVQEHGGLPITDRTAEEVMQDYEIESLCMDSLARSLERRGPKRIKWGLTIEVGEVEISANAIKSRRFSFEHIQEVLIAQRRTAEPEPAR